MFSPRRFSESPSTGRPRRTRVLRRSASALVVAALAVTACSSGDDAVLTEDAVSSDSGAEAVDAESAGVQQNGPVAVEGTALVPYDVGIEDPSIGQPAPVVSGESFDGTEMVIGAPTENPTMFVFLAHWCPHCNDEIPVLTGLDEEGRLPDGLDVVGVSTAVAADRENFPPSEWIVDRGWTWPTMADDEEASAIDAYGGTGFPFTVVLDTDGTVLARRSGSATADDTVAFLADALATASA